MEKLTLEYLAPYLPYGLRMMMCNGKIGFLSQITQNNGFGIQPYKVDLKTIQINGVTLTHGAKPILRPLSDLTKEIEHNGEIFVPMDYLTGKFGDTVGEWAYLYTHSQAEIGDIPYKAIKKMHEWFIDTGGLIAAGLAVDMNTI